MRSYLPTSGHIRGHIRRPGLALTDDWSTRRQSSVTFGPFKRRATISVIVSHAEYAPSPLPSAFGCDNGSGGRWSRLAGR
jgi:hypothetical protein